MKKLLFVLFAFTLFLSCNRNSESSDFFQCKIDGSNYEAEDLLAYAVMSGNGFAVYGLLSEDSDTETMYFTIDEDMGTGNYSLGVGQAGHAYYVGAATSFTYSTIFEGGMGRVIINSIDEERVSGTFSFTGINAANLSESVSITEGEFDVSFR